MADEDLPRVFTLLRNQRHGFLNHLQVISGWLQLGKTDRAVQYINRAAARMEEEGQALRRIDSPEVGLFVLEMGMEAEPYGVALEWRVAGAVDPEALPEAKERIKAVLEQVSSLPEGERRLAITLGRFIAVHTPPVRGEG